jgi:chemotaxis protein CheX
MRVELINPFISATQHVFGVMLGATLTRGPLGLKQSHAPTYEVSGLIGLCGSLQGMVVVTVGRLTAIHAAEAMLGARPAGLNGEVVDAIGELTNMIAGAAKTALAQHRLEIGLPTVIVGKSQSINFPSGSSPLSIPFDSDFGPICVEVGLAETPRA